MSKESAKKPKLPRVMITEELDDALNEFLAANPGVAKSYIIREALADFLSKYNMDIEDIHPPIGGYRIEKEE